MLAVSFTNTQFCAVNCILDVNQAIVSMTYKPTQITLIINNQKIVYMSEIPPII